MAIIDIPLNSGLITEVESEEIGARGCTELENAHLDVLGKVYKRQGRGANQATITGIKHIIKWIFNGTSYFVITDGLGKIFVTNNINSSSAILDTTDGIDIRISNYSSELRFALGLTQDARVYQYIDRNYFWGSHNPAAAFFLNTAKPTLFGTSDGFSLYDSGTMGDGSTFYGTNAIPNDIDWANNVYFYKISKVYDGRQEGPLPVTPTTSSGAIRSRAAANTIIHSEALATEGTYSNKYFGFVVKASGKVVLMKE